MYSHFIPIRMAIINYIYMTGNNNIGENVEKLKPLCITSGNIQWCSHCRKEFGSSLKTWTELSHGPASPHLGIQFKELKTGFKLILYTNVHSSIIHNRPKVETTQVSITRQTQCGILFSHKNKWKSDTCYNMEEPRKYYARWNVRHKRTNTVHFHSYDE